jgi:hypothetical protein
MYLPRRWYSLRARSTAANRPVPLFYAALAHRRRGRRLTVNQLLIRHRTGILLCELTGKSTPEQAFEHARELLGDLPPLPPAPLDARPARIPVTTAATSAPALSCAVCHQPLGNRIGVHKGCGRCRAWTAARRFPRTR